MTEQSRAAAVAALFEVLAALPGRLEALEREVGRQTAILERIEKALPPSLVSMKEAARVVGVSIQAMRRWVRKGLVASVKVGNTVRIDLTKFEAAGTEEIARRARLASARARR